MSSLQYGEVSFVLIPFYGQGNRLGEVQLPVQVYASSNLGLSDSDPRMFLTTVLCQTPTIYQICSIFKMTELFWICVHLFYFLTFKELFLPVYLKSHSFRIELGSQQTIKPWPEKQRMSHQVKAMRKGLDPSHLQGARGQMNLYRRPK